MTGNRESKGSGPGSLFDTLVILGRASREVLIGMFVLCVYLEKKMNGLQVS